MSKSTVIEKVKGLARRPPSFTPHPNQGCGQSHIVQSEIEGGVFLDSLQPATVLQIQTQRLWR